MAQSISISFKNAVGAVACAAVVLAGAAGLRAEDKHEHHSHSHEAPHGGTLVGLGECFAHLEFVHDAEGGMVTLYVLDGDAAKGVRLPNQDIAAEFTVKEPKSDEGALRLKLEAVENALTGEKVGNTSEFQATSPRLKGAKKLAGKIPALTIKGQEFKEIEFQIPADDSGQKEHDDHGGDKKSGKSDDGHKH